MNPDEVWTDLVQEVLGEPTVTDGKRRWRRMPCDVKVFHAAPFVTVRKTAWRNALRELEWLAYFNGHVPSLHASCRHWWARYADKRGYVEGVGFDIHPLLDGVRSSPYSRRNVLTSYSRGPCNVPRNDFVAQATVYDGRLDMFVCQRTCDLGRGAMHNWLQFWALLAWCAHHAEVQTGRLMWVAGDVHVYEEHVAVLDRCCRAARSQQPTLTYTPTWGTYLQAEDFALQGEYTPGNTEALQWV